jgi:hypothetical protein
MFHERGKRMNYGRLFGQRHGYPIFGLLCLLLISSTCLAEGRSEGRSDDGPGRSTPGLSVPIGGISSAGGRFTGSLRIVQFVPGSHGGVAALGMVSGTLFNAAGAPVGTTVQGPILFPVTIGPASTASLIQPQPGKSDVDDGPIGNPVQAPKLMTVSMKPVKTAMAPLAAPQATTCQPLNISIGAQSLNVAGLTVMTTPVDITLGGQTGGTNALGTLVCNILSTLTNVANLLNLVNRLLGLVSGLIP